ncbi:zinc-dependent metalloprotease [Tsukamurella soli]|uniref:zinc-dependent metalloprotease n=1 Tax=Tsukamurella soli TaxID=644556 RepID=UPI00360B8ACB
MADTVRVGERIDWGLAAATGRRLSRPGPATTGYTRDRAAEQLLGFAVSSEDHVRDTTGLTAAAAQRPARVVDRAEWITAAAESMGTLLGSPADAAPRPHRGGLLGVAAAVGAGLGEKVAGAQAGALLAFLSGAILGQFDPFAGGAADGVPAADPDGRGELLLVAPNIIGVERALDLVPDDFRMWVCLHEVTHRVQFGANPWLAGYMTDNVALISAQAGESTAEMLERLVGSLRGGSGADSGAQRQPGVLGVLQLLQGPEQFAAVENLLMLGTLLEGHADHVMDAVGPAVVPTVATIRAAFDRRRSRPQNPIQRLLRALLGLDAKTAQYVRGKQFVDAVVETVGMERFNAIWTSAETLPRTAEIEDPAAWIARVL